MISSNMLRSGHPSRITVSLSTPEGQRSGLKTEPVIMTDNLATILDHEIDRTIGQWTRLDSHNAALRHTLAL
jgi:mRNA interferase MazF